MIGVELPLVDKPGTLYRTAYFRINRVILLLKIPADNDLLILAYVILLSIASREKHLNIIW